MGSTSEGYGFHGTRLWAVILGGSSGFGLATARRLFDDLLSQAFTEMPRPEAEKRREEIRRRTTRTARHAEDWADQTLMR